MGGNQSALNIKYAVKMQKSLNADDDGESRAVREEVWMERRRRMDTDMQRWRERQMETDTEEAARETQDPINTYTYWIWKTSELMLSVRCVSVVRCETDDTCLDRVFSCGWNQILEIHSETRWTDEAGWPVALYTFGEYASISDFTF